MQITSGALRSLYVGFSAAFQRGFAGVQPSWNRIAMRVPSSTETNEYGWLENLPRIREWVGDRVIQGIKASDYRLRNKPWELTIGVDRDKIEDDNIGLFSPLFEEMGRATNSFPDELVYQLARDGFSTVCYDGQFFFDTDHPVLGEDGQTVVSVSNTGGGAGARWMLLDTSRPIKPFIFQERRAFDFVRMDAATDEVVFNRKEYRYGVDGRMTAGYGLWQLAYGSRQTLNSASYAAARAALLDMRGDHGRPLGVMPNLLVVPPSLETAARQILNADQDAAGASNVWRNTAELMVTPWMA